MQGPPRVIQFVFEPLNFLAQLVPLLPIPGAILIRPFVLSAQSLDLALLLFQFSDQLLARRRAPLHSQHTVLMPCLKEKYKWNCGARAAQMAGQ
jgi:hypothetical protein